MNLELHFVTFICISFGDCRVIFAYKEILCFFGHCHVTFPYMEPISFYGNLGQNIIVSCFSDSFVQKTTQKSDGSCSVTVIPSHHTSFSKNSFFICVKTFEKNFVSKEHCIAHHDDKMLFLPNCRYHKNLIGNLKECLQKLDAFCFNDQHVDCLYTLFKYRFSSKTVLKRRQLFDNLQRVVHFNQQNRGVERMPSIVKKRVLRIKYKKHLLSSLQKTKMT